ncbi:splicing factor 3B subunit 1-like [Dorcoceras hygrometricum]|uniref:Splicing factor 3B subunit 1-like n=1 Tax=Dorcoceras hygrometricum TaxID=472368 RepID=A0A2Z7D5W4_9LAMI|nr:splicing factor 3B subunit 1-like [Dorcoceras hygrometricum]
MLCMRTRLQLKTGSQRNLKKHLNNTTDQLSKSVHGVCEHMELPLVSAHGTRCTQTNTSPRGTRGQTPVRRATEKQQLNSNRLNANAMYENKTTTEDREPKKSQETSQQHNRSTEQKCPRAHEMWELPTSLIVANRSQQGDETYGSYPLILQYQHPDLTPKTRSNLKATRLHRSTPQHEPGLRIGSVHAQLTTRTYSNLDPCQTTMFRYPRDIFHLLDQNGARLPDLITGSEYS